MAFKSVTSAALAAALLALSAAFVLSLPPNVLPGVVEVSLRDGGAGGGCEVLPRTRPGWVKGSASFADFEHKPPIVVDGEIYQKAVERGRRKQRYQMLGVRDIVLQRLNSNQFR